MIKSSRTLSFLSILAFIMGFTFIFLMSSLTQAIIEKKQELTVNTYGDFLAVVSNLNLEEKEQVIEKLPQYEYDEFQIVGDISYENDNYVLGYMKEKIGRHLGFQLSCGEWPSKVDEIAIEKYLALKMDVRKDNLPYQLNFIEDGQIKNYKITGIITNYSCNLSINSDDILENPIYPSIICGKIIDERESFSLVVRQNKLNFKSATQDIFQFIDDYTELNQTATTLSLNEKLNFEGYKRTEVLESSNNAHKILLCIILLLSEFVIISSFIMKSKQVFYLFEALGLSIRKRKHMLALLLAFFIVMSLVVSLLIAVILGCTLIHWKFSDYSYYFMDNLFHTFLIQFGIAIVSFCCFYIVILNVNHTSIIEGLGRKNGIKSKIKFKKISLQMILLQAILLFFILSSMNFINMFTFGEEDISYSICSKQSYSCEIFNNFYIARYGDIYYDFKALDSMKPYDNYYRCSIEAETKLASLLLKKEEVDQYFVNIIDNYSSENTNAINSIIEGNIPQEVYDYIAIPKDAVQILILPQDDFNEFMIKNGIQNDSLENNLEMSCILYVEGYNTKQENPSIIENGTIQLGGIMADRETVTFRTQAFSVGSLITTTSRPMMPITVIMSEEIARKSSLVLGFNTMQFTIDKNCKSEVLEEIDNQLYTIAASVQGGILNSSKQDQMEATLLKGFTTILSSTILIFCGLAIITYIILSTHIDWEKHKQEYGVLRSYGMSYSILQRKLFLQYTSSIIVACLVSIVIGKQAFTGDSLTNKQILIAIIITVIITYACRFMLYFIYKKQSICNMLNKT